MKILDEMISLLLQRFERPLLHDDIYKEGQKFLSYDPQIICCLLVFLCELSEVVILSVRIQPQEAG